MGQVTLLWLGLGLLLSLSSQLLIEHLWILALAPAGAWILMGAVLMFVALWRLRRAAERPFALRVIGSVLGGVVLYYPISLLGARITAQTRFRWNQSQYESLVARRPPPDGRLGAIQYADGLEFIVDPGPPWRVAFPWPGGIIDNWCGAVFDPTGRVVPSKDGVGGGPRSTVPEDLFKLFGGDLVSCRSLSPPYYLCCFT